MPKVSIIIPNYNYAKYLDERIQSLLNQTFKDFELIIIDDASTDNSLEIIRRYTSDPRIRFHFYKENSGFPYKRWNDGAELANGEFLLFAGADDNCEPTLLEELMEKMVKHPSVGLSYCQSWEIDTNGKKIRTLKFGTDRLDRERWSNDFIDKGINECFYLLFQNTIPNASAVLLRRKDFFNAGKFDESLKILADWMLWAKILFQADVAFIAQPLNYFRTHQGSVRQKFLRSGVFVEESYKVINHILENLQIPEKALERVLNKQMNMWTQRLFLRGVKIPFKRNIIIYRLATHLDPRVKSRFIRKFILNLYRKFNDYS